ncbi:MAG TPA: signal recognition particle-docking protein FtsY [Gammaproteobacteria bacterium]|nr:signal recognition particle-docking protein FtsY [Gammaproteobacteria bacterium]
MLDFLKWGKKTESPEFKDSDPKDFEPKGMFARLKNGLRRTRAVFSEGLAHVFLGKKEIDSVLLAELETFLLSADIGLSSTEQIMQDLTNRLERRELSDPAGLALALKQDLNQLLSSSQAPLVLGDKKPFVILMVGINGAGKTTTIGKLAKKLEVEGKKVILAAGDTFRAAAIEQLKIWGERNNTPVIAQHMGADSASVIFDAFQTAKAKGFDVLIADTAGRLHTQESLMEELKKVVRVMRKLDEQAPHEIMLVLDAGIGQNALVQAQKFNEALGVTGITLTKLDGTAKGGMIFNIAKTLKIPIRFIGIGEGIDDLRPFESTSLVDALFSSEEI